MDFKATKWKHQRLGGYFIPEVSDAPPGPPLDPDAARRYWEETFGEYRARLRRRKAAYPGRDAPPQEHESAHAFRYGQKIEIKCMEAALDLFHRIVAPEAVVCGEACEHLREGVSAAAAGRYLASLDAALERLDGLIGRAQSHRVLEDYLDEKGSYRRRKARYLELAGTTA